MSPSAAAATSTERALRARVVASTPVAEHHMDLAGVPTAVLVGGDGPPMVLLHGPGQSALWWRRVFPALVRTHRVVAPDLPGQGATGAPAGGVTERFVVEWLDALIARACAAAPVLVGHELGGAVALRYAVRSGHRLDRLVLVSTLGLAPFRPSARFALRLARLLARPDEGAQERFFEVCQRDSRRLAADMGDDWEPFARYYLERFRAPGARSALRRILNSVGTPPVPHADLARLRVPTSLIWGRHDRAVSVSVAEAASARYGWPLHVLEDAGADPHVEEPEAFVAALLRAAQGEGTAPPSGRAAVATAEKIS